MRVLYLAPFVTTSAVEFASEADVLTAALKYLKSPSVLVKDPREWYVTWPGSREDYSSKSLHATKNAIRAALQTT